MRESIHKSINRIIDRFTGFGIDQELERILTFDAYDHQQIVDYHREAFQKLAYYATQAEFYKPYADQPLEAFPLMDRETYVQKPDQLITHAASPIHKPRSSGSTGTPVTHFVTREMLLAKRVSHQKMLHWYGLTRESSEMKMGGFPVDIKTRVYYRLRNKRYLKSHLFGVKNIPVIAKRFNRFKPKVLYGYPSIIHEFVMQAQIRGLKLHIPQIVVLHAENLSEEVKGRIEEALPGASVVNQYWSTEANIAVTCPHGKLHLDEDSVFCEVLNQDEGGTGDLYITNLHSYALPIIRYRLGDRIRLAKEPCSCGRATRVIAQIEGREMDYVYLPDGTRYPTNSFHFSNETTNILSYQMLYSRERKHMGFRYVPIDSALPIEQEKIAAYMKEQFGLTSSFEQVEALEQTAGGKTKKIIDLDTEAKP